MTRRPRIVADPATSLGKPRLAGTRIAVEPILDRSAEGASVEELLADHPHLERARPDWLAPDLAALAERLGARRATSRVRPEAGPARP